VDAFVLWDPVSDGAGFLRQLRTEGTPSLTSDGGFESHGFPLPRKLQEEIAQIRPESFDSAPSRVFLAVSEDLEEHGRLAEQLSAVGADVEVSIRPNPACWAEHGNFGVGAMPADLIQAIASWRP
jgi:hypothetical protein